MASLMQWATAPWGSPLPFEFDTVPGVEHPTRLQVLAMLRALDSGGYGIIDGGGIYGRRGLHQSEAFVWWELKAFVNGWLEGTDGAEDEVFMAALHEEWARVKALADARSSQQEPPP
jgi:hypothetical protein